MNINIKKKAELKISKWSAGTTSELCIYPPDSSYQDVDFTYRISTATVDSDESTFTCLPNMSRYLMLIEGKLHIKHENHHEIILKKFETDSFKGDWHTTSKGKAVDFNLMTNEDNKGSINYIDLKQDDLYMDDISEEELAIAYYLTTGSVTININEEEFTLQTGDFIEINELDDDELIQITALENSKLIVARIE